MAIFFLLEIASPRVGVPYGGEHQVGDGLRRLLQVVRVDRVAAMLRIHQLALAVDLKP